MKRLSLLAIAFVSLVAAVGCKSQGQAGCEDLVSTYAERLVECGEYSSQSEAEDALVAALAAGTPSSVNDCGDFVRLRDVTEFRDQCIPALEALPCGTSDLPAPCQGQLLYDE